jgi:hypothetical protein
MILYLLVLGSGMLGLLAYAAWLYGVDSRDYRDWREHPDARRSQIG